jgi:hypothetical protein
MLNNAMKLLGVQFRNSAPQLEDHHLAICPLATACETFVQRVSIHNDEARHDE